MYYLAFIIVHYVSAICYAKFCTPLTLWGFITSPFLTTAPHCAGLRYVVNYTGNNIANMWVLFGAWILSNIV